MPNLSTTGSMLHQHCPRVVYPMKGYLQNIQFIMLNQAREQSILTTASLSLLNKCIVNGNNNRCYNYILGGCTVEFCAIKTCGGHALASEILPEFVNKMVETLSVHCLSFPAKQL